MKLREYQERMVSGALSALMKNQRVLVQSATGSGKTVVAAAIASRSKRRVLFVSNRDNHLDNWAAATRSFKCKSEALTVQSASHRDIAKPGLIIVDEAHHSKAQSYQSLLERFPDAKVIGLTATPQRLDGKPLADIYQAMVEGPKVSELIAGGFVAQPRYFGVPQAKRANLAAIHRQRGDYDRKELATASRFLVGSIVDEWKRRANVVPTLAFAIDVEHATRIERAFKRAGVKARKIAGNDGPKERQRAREDLLSGKLQIIVSVDMYGEGWDCPEARCAILARPTLSLVLHLQQCGRVMRPGAVRPIILDHAGNLEALGYPDIDREWSLTTGAIVTRKTVNDFGREKTCPECGNTCTLSARECRWCGYSWSEEKMREIEAEIEELRQCSTRQPMLCLDCNVPIHHNADRCVFCASKARRKPRNTCNLCGKELSASHRSKQKTLVCKSCKCAEKRFRCVSCDAETALPQSKPPSTGLCRKCWESGMLRSARKTCVDCGKELSHSAKSIGYDKCITCSNKARTRVIDRHCQVCGLKLRNKYSRSTKCRSCAAKARVAK